MNTQEIRAILIKKLSEALRPHGFKQSSGTFTRQRGVFTHIINLQGDNWNQGDEATYYINLAIYYDRVAEIEDGHARTTAPKEYDGQLRSRLMGEGVPKSWDFSAKIDSERLMSKLVDAVIYYGLPYFEGIDTPLQLANCIMDDKKDGMKMITGHISRAIIYSIEGDKSSAQTELDTYFKKNEYIKEDKPGSRSVKRRYLCIAQRIGLKLRFPELEGETCVGFYIPMKGKQLIRDERRTSNKLELFLRNLEKKNLGYIHYYGYFRRPGTYRIGFCTNDPSTVVQYISERKDKFPNPLQEIIVSDEF